LLASLYLLTQATEDSERFGRLYLWLLAFNGAVLIFLLGLIAANLRRLWRSLRQREPGALLTRRILVRFTLLAVIPGLVVYGFSMRFLRSGIDSWFDVPVESSLEDAIELRKRDRLDRVESEIGQLDDPREGMLPVILGDMRERMQASELTLFGSNGQILASSSRTAEGILPPRPGAGLRSRARQGRPYVGLDEIEDGRRQIRVVVPAPNPSRPGDKRVLQALFPVSPRLNRLADNIREIKAEYGEVTAFREELKDSFGLTLSLVLLGSLLFALWSAFYLARRLVAPVTSLAEGTQAVAAGDYGTQLPRAANDELGFLLRSFNDMSRRVAQARDEARREQVIAESQRQYLETVLARLSSGVLTFDQEGQLRTYNQAANQILSRDFGGEVGNTLSAMAASHPELAPFAERVGERAANRDDDWREQLTLNIAAGRRVLMCSGTQLPGGRVSGGHVVVFDDVTALIQAQRDAAWGEVARRLAHEIRNPLTPIQLSAERLQHKLGGSLEGGQAEVLGTATRTIIEQVETLKAMVNAFSEYARPPQLELKALDLSALVEDVAELYQGQDEGPLIELTLASSPAPVHADSDRLRQLLNNLIRNAIEAVAEPSSCRVTLLTREVRRDTGDEVEAIELVVRDTGPGFAAEVLNELFEPYVTTKSRGTGLGLPIVKKIVEEHNGTISARNTVTGAEITISLPVAGIAAPLPVSNEHSAG
jgi:nitrogen fixation/metabolism regulation signal transduction histidine kinase